MSDHSAENDAAEECEFTYVVEAWQPVAAEWSSVSVHFRTSAQARDYARRSREKFPSRGLRIVKVHTHVTRMVIDQTRVIPPGVGDKDDAQ